MTERDRPARPVRNWRWIAALLAVAVVAPHVFGAPPDRPSVTETYESKLPAPEFLTGFRLLSPENPNNPDDPAHRGTLTRHYVRDRDGARLELEASQTFMTSTLRPRAKQEITSYGSVASGTFSGLPLGEWALCNASPRRTHAILAVEDNHWLLLAHLITKGTVPLSDLMLLENAFRHVLAPQRPEPVFPGHSIPKVVYRISGQVQLGFQFLGGCETAPVVPILRAAGLRVVASKDLPAVRGWRGDHLVISIAAGARELLVEGKLVPLGGVRHCTLIDGQLNAPITAVAVHVGLCTYFTGPNRNEPTFCVEVPTAPRPIAVVNLALPR